MKRSMHIVVNPQAGRGSAAERLGAMRAALERVGFSTEVSATEHPGHAAEIVRRLVSKRVELIGIMGGDGTVHDAINGLASPSNDPTGDLAREGSASELPLFALLPSGTGGDFRRTFGMGTEPESVATYLASARSREIDLGTVDFVTDEGVPRRCLFVNIAGFGIGGLVDRYVATIPRWMGGKAGYYLAALRARVRYRNAPVRVHVDGMLVNDGPVFTVAVANGRAFGGGMLVAPEADPSDGLFDVIVMGDLSLTAQLRLTFELYKGTHVRRSDIAIVRGREVTAETLGPPHATLDIDGEAPGRVSARFAIISRAVRLLVSDSTSS